LSRSHPTGTKGAGHGRCQVPHGYGPVQGTIASILSALRDLAEDADDAQRLCGHENEERFETTYLNKHDGPDLSPGGWPNWASICGRSIGVEVWR
jgi:hypothetical protein